MRHKYSSGKKAWSFCCKPQAQRTATHFPAFNRLHKMPFRATGKVFCPTCWRAAHSLPVPSNKAEMQQPTPVQTGRHPSPTASFSHTLEKPTTPTQTHQPRQVKEMYEISTNHCSEDKVVWLSPGTLRLLINYEELLHHLLCSVEQQTCNRDSIETAPVINTKFSLYSATCFYS